MAKVSTSDITNILTAAATINSNFDLLVAELDNVLSLDGSTPSGMQSNLDMNGYTIINSPGIDTVLNSLGSLQVLETAAAVSAASAATSATSASSSASAAAASLAAIGASETNAATSAAEALSSQTAAAASEVATAADVVLTNADVVSTNTDAASTAADAIATAADAVSTAADVVLTNADAASTAADAIATAADRVQTGLDATSASTSAAEAAASAASVTTDHDSLNNVMLPTDWQTVNKQGWDHFGFNQQWGGAPWGGRLPDGTDGEVTTGVLEPNLALPIGSTAGTTHRSMGFQVPKNCNCLSIPLLLAKVGNPTWNIEVYIYDDNAGAPGALVTNGTATAQNGKLHSSSLSEVMFSFPTPPALAANTQYHLVIKIQTINVSHYWNVYGNISESYGYGYLHNGDATPTWTPFTTYALCFKVIPTAATSTILNGEFNAADTTQLGQAPALTQSLKDVIKRDKDGKFTFQFKVGDVPTASKPLCQAYYDNDTHITVETDASSHAIIRSNGSTITGTSILAADDSVAAMYNGTNLALYVNGVAEGIAVAASYPDDFDTGSFIIGGAIPTDLTWTKETDMSLLPSADGWTYGGTAVESSAFSVSGGKLYQNAAGAVSASAKYTIATALNNTTGWRIDTKLQVLNSDNTTAAGSVDLRIDDGVKYIQVLFQEYFIECYDSANKVYVQVDMKSKPRGVTVLGKGSDLYLFVDGKLVYDGTGILTGTSAANTILIGDINASPGISADAIWHYVNCIQSYEAPTFTSTALYDFGFWQKDASSLLVDLAASDVKSITGLKRDWVEEAERGISTRGVTPSVATTSTSFIPIPDLSIFAIGGHIKSTLGDETSNNTASTFSYLTTYADGVGGKVISARHQSSGISHTIPKSTIELLERYHGMNFIQGMYRTSAGTITQNIDRSLIVEAK